MAKENKKIDPKKPKFNAYWIYIPIILIFVGLQFFGGGSLATASKTTQEDFQRYLKDGDVEKIEIVNKKLAKVYLTPEARAKEIHKTLRQGY